jgi:hypothetical protein
MVIIDLFATFWGAGSKFSGEDGHVLLAVHQAVGRPRTESNKDRAHRAMDTRTHSTI